jgi:hypothetical protein
MTYRFKLYSNQPQEKSLVNFIFTEHGKDCFKCYLTDYDIEAIMPFQLATLKNSLKKNINTLAPLNKPLIGSIEEIIDDTIVISIAYIDKESLEYKQFEEMNIKNKRLVSSIMQYTTKNKLNFYDFWKDTIYPIDEKRNELTLLDYILENIEELQTNNIFDKILSDSLLSITVKTSHPITKFNMVSLNGVANIKKIISLALEETNTKDLIDINIESSPIYQIISKDFNIDNSYHLSFLEVLEKLGKLPENSIFISKET